MLQVYMLFILKNALIFFYSKYKYRRCSSQWDCKIWLSAILGDRTKTQFGMHPTVLYLMSFLAQVKWLENKVYFYWKCLGTFI